MKPLKKLEDHIAADMKLAEIAKQDSAAFVDLLGLMKPFIYSAIAKASLNLNIDSQQCIIEDIFQNVTYKLLLAVKRGNYKGKSKLSTFVYRIAYNSTVDYGRKVLCYNNLIDRFGRLYLNNNVTNDNVTNDNGTNNTRNPFDEIASKDSIQTILDAVDLLSDIQASAVRLKIAGHSESDIASLEGLSRATIASRLMYARNNLKRILSKHYDDPMLRA